MRDKLLLIWKIIADKAGVNDMTAHDMIMVEITRRQNMMIREIESSRTMIDLLHCRACIKSYIANQFDWSYVQTSIMILNSHLAWKQKELEQQLKSK